MSGTVLINRNMTTKCPKGLQKRSIDDNLRQLVLVRQVILNFSFVFNFSKKKKNGSVGRWETKHFMGMA